MALIYKRDRAWVHVTRALTRIVRILVTPFAQVSRKYSNSTHYANFVRFARTIIRCGLNVNGARNAVCGVSV